MRAPGELVDELADAIEADTALAITVMRAANNGAGPSGRTGGVREAVEALQVDSVRSLAQAVDTYDVLDAPGVASDRNERFRRHAVAVRIAAERVGEVARLSQRDELAVAALLHDVGKLVLASSTATRLRPRAARSRPTIAPAASAASSASTMPWSAPSSFRRWGMPKIISGAVERHHSPDATGHAAAIRLADMIVHHAAGDPVSADAMRDAAAALKLDDQALSGLLFEFPHASERRRRAAEPCPLSMREMDALRGLAEGKVYKQIAVELTLSVSTVRTHLHNVYRKIGAVDRAQAVLIATDRGWL